MMSMQAPVEAGMIWEVWRHWAETRPEADAIIHWVPEGPPHRWTFGALYAAALERAWQLWEHGVRPGDVCALIVRHHPAFYPLYMGIVGVGAIPAVLAYPNARLHPDKFREGIRGMAGKSGLDVILTEAELGPVLEPLIRHDHSSIRDMWCPIDVPTAPVGPAQIATLDQARASLTPASPLLLQHSSGTTGLQKAVVLSHDAVLGHIDRYARSIQLTESDRIASWLPLYHDMGLIAAFHLPLATGLASVQISPFHWVSAPITLWEAVSQERCTIAWLPNFAYNLMADTIHEEDLAALKLDGVRLLINCSEPVRADSHERFLRRFATHGVTPGCLSACYAMAETTFAVTQTPPGDPPIVVDVDRGALATGRVEAPASPGAPARRCVSSGRPIVDCEVRVVGDDGQDLGDDRVGQILIRSVSMFSGYRSRGHVETVVSADGWYTSGDVGFMRGGECFVIGRSKDVIIVAGNNVFPEDIEDAVSAVPGVMPGRVVAFGVDNARTGTEQIEVAAETAWPAGADQDRLRAAIVDAVRVLDMTVARVHLMEPRSLIKSSSGKPSRKANRERILSREREGTQT